jgi:hypothetical protein
MGGANAGMIQKGNIANVSTPIAPVSIDILVKTFAARAVNKISTVPKIFQ